MSEATQERPLLLTKTAAARLIGVSRPTLDKMLANGEIPTAALYRSKAMADLRFLRVELERTFAASVGRKK